LAAGDSYASGQGLTHTTEPCADGTGKNGLSTTWAIAAANTLNGQGTHFAHNSPDLVACTGAITDQFFHADGANHGAPQWRPSMKRYDLVTFSFGGDDINFSNVMSHCEMFGCPSDNSVRTLISTMGTYGVSIDGTHTASYQTFLQDLANKAVVHGGNIVVMGYPELVEDVGLWSAGRTTCAGMSAGEVQRVRGWAGYLNATIGAAVATVNGLDASKRNGVHLTFIDPVSGSSAHGISANDPNLFEPSSGTRHELCSTPGPSWVNGLSDLHLESRSFHPNQAGETAMGALAAEVIAQLTWPWAPWDSAPVSAPVGLASLVPWGQYGVSAPWNGCNLYLPTTSGIALQGPPTYYAITTAGYVPQASAAVSGSASGIFYSIDFNDAMGEVVVPPGIQPPYSPDPNFPGNITTYSDGSTVQNFGGDSDIDLITIPGQACKYELMTVTAYPPPPSAFFALVNSLRPIQGGHWRTPPEPSVPACDPNLLFQAAVAEEGFNPNDPSYAQIAATGGGPGASGQVCDQGWAVAAISRPNVGTTDGFTLFRVNSQGAWAEVGTLGGSAAECQLTADGVPPDVAAVLSGGNAHSGIAGCWSAIDLSTSSSSNGIATAPESLSFCC
jgi:hypothetical protein